MSLNDADAWQLEETLWTGPWHLLEEYVDPHGVMAFPPPTGIMPASAIAQVSEGPRWTQVTMSDRVLSRPHASLLVVGYAAEARRRPWDLYQAYCTSTYRDTGDGWKLIQHQQTPFQR